MDTVRNKLFTRLISLLTAAALLFSLCGCAGQQNGASAASETTTAKAADPWLPVAHAADLMEDFTPGKVSTLEPDENFRMNYLTFGIRLLQKLYAGQEENKTLLISPLSVMAALTMTALGAEGETLAEMEALLGSGLLPIGDLTSMLCSYLHALPSEENAFFASANSIWFKDSPDFSVKKSFLQKNVDYFGAGIYKAAFDETTLRDINQWVAVKTHDMIPSILDRLSPEDRMVLINALVFEAKWAVPFSDESALQKEDFTCLDGTKTSVMQMYGSEKLYLSDDTCTGFMKPYMGGRYRFVALLPNEDLNLTDFVASLDAAKIRDLLQNPESIKTYIKLPQFSFDFGASLVDTLADLGMKRAFTVMAQFDGIGRDSSGPLVIGDVLHKTHIDVDSDGTRAAAVTAVLIKAESAIQEPEQTRQVWLDRPFVYMIVDTENLLPVFIGTVSEFTE